MTVEPTGGRTAAASEDEALMLRLSELFAAGDPPPAALVDRAKWTFGLRTVETELAALTADSYLDEVALAVRADAALDDPRLLTFESAEMAIEVEVSRLGEHRRLLGQLLPPGPAFVELRQTEVPDARSTHADDAGRFVLENAHPGPVSLICRMSGRQPVVTEWVGLD